MNLITHLPCEDLGKFCTIKQDAMESFRARASEYSEKELSDTGIILGYMKGYDGPVYSVFTMSGIHWHFPADDLEINKESTCDHAMGVLELMDLDEDSPEISARAISAIKDELRKRIRDEKRLRGSA